VVFDSFISRSLYDARLAFGWLNSTQAYKHNRHCHHRPIAHAILSSTSLCLELMTRAKWDANNHLTHCKALKYSHCDGGHGYMLSQSCYISDRHVKCGSRCHTCKSMGSRKDITSGMACILCEYYSTFGETSFLFYLYIQMQTSISQ